ncbi:MAG: YbdK family carboxylate-amine ligase, partial [Anaerolineae bacterium]
RVKTEIHQSMVEVDSEISENVKQCREFLNNRILRLNNIVEDFGLQLAVTGTHPFQHWAERLISNSDRYQNVHEKFQWLARRMNVYGMHVHIGVSSGDRALAICKAMVQYLPHLLALSANSPFWQGIDTGMQSSRINILDGFPFSGLPPDISNWKQFEHYYDTLHRVEAIKSFKDLYWYVRPNLLYGTIEIRICDAMSTLNETMALVALIQCLVAKSNEELDKSCREKWTTEHHWIAPENQWIAARDGLEGMIIINLQGKRQKISDAILELIDLLSPIAKVLNCHEEIIYLNTIIKNGNGAQRQRKTSNETGSLKEVVRIAQEEFRLSLQEICPMDLSE